MTVINTWPVYDSGTKEYNKGYIEFTVSHNFYKKSWMTRSKGVHGEIKKGPRKWYHQKNRGQSRIETGLKNNVCLHLVPAIRWKTQTEITGGLTLLYVGPCPYFCKRSNLHATVSGPQPKFQSLQFRGSCEYWIKGRDHGTKWPIAVPKK